jgi:hypothetical protein
MMKTFCAVVGLLCLLSQGAFALDYRGVGNWADPNGWSDGAPPSGAVEVKIRGADTILTLNTGTGDWGPAQRLRVYEGATLIVEEGAELLGAGWARVGANNAGYLEQTGGLVQIDNDRLGIGDSAGSDGHYTMSGGTLTYAGDRGDLIVGARGGTGVFTVAGTGPAIQMGKLIVGDAAGASGTVEFRLTAEGVSPITLAISAAIDALGDETLSALVIGSAGGAPQADVVLVDLPDGVVAETGFDTVNGEPAVEGATVVVHDRMTTYTYTLTYAGGAAGNDIMLLYVSMVPAPKVIYVTDTPDINGDGLMDDDSVIDWLKAEGYDVDARRGYWQTLDPNKIDELNAADLIIASCGLSTGNYDDGDEPTQWNSLTTPMINFNSWLLRTSRWKWMNSNTATKDSGSPTLFAVDPNHPIFAGVALDANDLVQVLDPNVGSQQTSFLADILDVGNGTLLASSVGIYTTAWIAEWAPGVEYYAGAGQFAGGPRMMFMATAQETGAPSKQGEFNLNEAGQQILRNMMAYLLSKGQEQEESPDVGAPSGQP